MSNPMTDRHIIDTYRKDRIEAEIAYVRDLASLYPDQIAAWQKLADESAASWAQGLSQGLPTNEALAQAEAILAPVAKVARSYTVHCVGHAHIDMNWQWPWQETVETTIETTRSVLRLLREYPAFCFSQSQTSVYEILRSYAPELFEEVRQRIREGRWEVTASHWVEGERNTAGAEAIVRQLVCARAWMHEHLGLKPEEVLIDWVPDCFGHAATIPAIDARAGVRHYYLWRSGGIDRPVAFWWKAPDESKVLVCRETAANGLGYNNTLVPQLGKDLINFVRETKGHDWMAVYGVGDHGGGPTRRYIARAIDMDTWPIWPRVQFSTSRRFFATLEKLNLPTWDKELNAEYSGCLISQSAIKRANRQAENALTEADAASALAHSACGLKVQSERLTLAWREALLTHFHDILPGSGVAATRNYTLGMTQRILADTSSIQSKALATLAAAIDTSTVGAPNLNVTVPTQMPVNLGAGAGFTVGGASGAQPTDGWPVAAILTNPTTWPRSEIATLRVWEGNIPWGSQPSTTNFALRDNSGETISAQFLRTGRYWGHTYIDVAAPVAVAANGWTTYAVLADTPAQAGTKRVESVQDREGGQNHPPIVPLPSGRLGFDNDLLSVRFDRVRGGIKSLIHRPSGKEFVPVGACLGLPVLALERPYQMSSWIINDHKSSFSPACESLEVTAEGPFLATIVAKFHHGDSRITLTWTLGAGENHLRLNVEVRWLEHGSQEKGTPRLSLSLPLNIVNPVATAEIPFGNLERHEKPGRTMPCVRYFAVNGSCGSVTVANDGLSNYALEADGATIHLLRSSYGPDPLPEIGDHTWNLTLTPSPEAFSATKAHQQAVNLNHPLRWTITDGHPGRLPATSGPILTSSPRTAITQVKPAEDGKGIILRVQELAGVSGQTQIDLDPAVWGTITAATPVDLLERPCDEGPVKFQGQNITAHVIAHSILSIRVTAIQKKMVTAQASLCSV